MVLPGIQALFGFQLMVIFSDGFKKLLSVSEQHLHGAALTAIGFAIALIMTPAAYHRLAGARHVSDDFINACTRILLCAMVPLMLGVCTDFYLCTRVLWDATCAAILTGGLVVVFVAMWFVLPRLLIARSRQKVTGRG